MRRFVILCLLISNWTNQAQSKCVGTNRIDSLPKKNSKPQQTLKTINYRGGLISFDIPKIWAEQYEDAGGGIFYEDIPNSGTLRVNVLTLKSKEGGSPLEVLKGGENRINQKEYHSQSGDEILEYLVRTKENGTPITMFTLACAHKTKQQDFLLAVFTWTIETRFENQENYIREWDMIHSQIQAVKFGR